MFQLQRQNIVPGFCQICHIIYVTVHKNSTLSCSHFLHKPGKPDSLFSTKNVKHFLKENVRNKSCLEKLCNFANAFITKTQF